MTKRAPTPVRFDADVALRLAAFVAANPGLSPSSAANGGVARRIVLVVRHLRLVQ